MDTTAGPPAQPPNQSFWSSVQYRAREKVIKMSKETKKLNEYYHLQMFLFHLLALLYGMRYQMDDDMHAYLRNVGDEPRVIISLPRPRHKDSTFFAASDRLVRELRLNKQAEPPKSFQMCWYLYEGDKANEVVVTYGDKPEQTGNFDLSACLKRFPSEKIDLGVIGLAGQDGTPADNVMYCPTLKDVYFTSDGMSDLVDALEKNYAEEENR
ncbi:hypothetical protein F5Y03DRAFT_409592 [Xylaria venustula]|nr:hypothetical protein F5Y03DRAFT_409592 [Xylaria venustula]